MTGSTRQVGVAVIGCGARGTTHAQSWAKLGDVSIRAVRDLIPERAETLARRHGAEVSDDYRNAIDRPDVDIVSVCTPTDFHPEAMVFAAECGKHVLCEKPMALSLTEGRRMMDAAERNKVKLTFSFQNQYSEATEKLRDLMDTGDIGRPVMARQVSCAEIRAKLAMHDRRGNNGPVVDSACHTYTLWRYIFRSEPVRVQAGGLTIAAESDVLAGIEQVAVDTATLIITFASGDIGVFSTTWGLPRGTKSSSSSDILGPGGMIMPSQRSLRVVKGADEVELGGLVRGGDDAQVAAFLDCIRRDTQPRNTARDAYVALQVSLAALESIETGQAVSIEPLGT